MKKSTKEVKTNAVRILEGENITYELMEYDVSDGKVDGISVAEKTGQSATAVFKTLVTKANTGELFVFLLPVALELDLKKAAKAVGVKKLEMLPLKDLTKETGYIRGGCSPVGMKRKYTTIIDEAAEKLNYITVSAGKPGLQMKLTTEALSKMTNAVVQDVVKN